jgi:hypothetical protein
MRKRRLEARTDTWRPEAPRIVFWLVVLAGALAAGSGLGAELSRLTTKQMEALPHGEADRTVKADLISVLQPVGKFSQGRRFYLHKVDQMTLPFGTRYHALCRRDVVRLWYAPTDDAGPFPDRKLRPYSVEARAQFALRGALPITTPGPRDPERVWRADCSLQGDDTAVDWFYAPDEPQAALALNLLDAARSRVKAGTLKAYDQALMKTIGPRDIDRIEPCRAEPNMICYRYVLRSSPVVTVVAEYEDRDAKVDPEDVVSVDDGEVLIDDNPDGWP